MLLDIVRVLPLATNHIKKKILETFTVVGLVRLLANKLFQNADVNTVWYAR